MRGSQVTGDVSLTFTKRRSQHRRQSARSGCCLLDSSGL